MFSLSLNPPGHETVSIDEFEAAIEATEVKLGLQGQPRAIVFHEKDGRRHARVVWSRIDAGKMKAINMASPGCTSRKARKPGKPGRMASAHPCVAPGQSP